MKKSIPLFVFTGPFPYLPVMKKSDGKISRAELQKLYRAHRVPIRLRLKDFSSVPPCEYFYELIYCLLTPQSSAANAGKAVSSLKKHDFMNRTLDPESLLGSRDFYIRFHKTKAKNLLALKEKFPLMAQELSSGKGGHELRQWLVNNVRGLGWKEASHFLRNIGHTNLAILDRHILRNLTRTGAVRQLPRTLTRKRYLLIEKKFQSFAHKIKIPMDELDLLFWSMETGEILK